LQSNDTGSSPANRTTQLAITDEELSIGVSVVLLALYAANLVYTLITHRDVFASDE
jgi:Ca2+:H+ antiporter